MPPAQQRRRQRRCRRLSRPRFGLGVWAATWVESETACRVCGRYGVGGETWRSWWRVIAPESRGPDWPTRSASQDRPANELPNPDYSLPCSANRDVRVSSTGEEL